MNRLRQHIMSFPTNKNPYIPYIICHSFKKLLSYTIIRETGYQTFPSLLFTLISLFVFIVILLSFYL